MLVQEMPDTQQEQPETQQQGQLTEQQQQAVKNAATADNSQDEGKADMGKYIPRQYADIELNQWQQQLLDTRLEFNDRWVDCLVDPKGNIGKTTVAAVGELKYGCLDVPTVDNGDKITQSICGMLHNSSRNPALILSLIHI